MSLFYSQNDDFVTTTNIPEARNTKNAPMRKRKANPPGYTTRLQQQKKAELRGLRDHVRQLEEPVEQLKRLRPYKPARGVLDPQIAAQQVKWEQLVATEHEARRQSEETNRKLKEILAHQVELDKNLRRILDKRSLLQESILYSGTNPHLDTHEIHQRLRDDSGSSFNDTRAVPYADICWKDLSIPRSCPEKWCQSYVKQVKGVQFLRKYIEPNRIVIIKADMMMLNNEGLHFRDQKWTIISRAQTNPKACVVPTARPEDVDYAQNVVLKNLNWKLREHTTHLQDQLIEETQKNGMMLLMTAQ
ncbi:hypothetical protein GN244_ATG17072 [Phytophthora infestans]|uniref:M96 mating-specific protein family n=1 Tax=Phytophthora infestans TaxID=4787 RepID=A0A833WLG1_PHYIN|nr:hypothetical protein GN244_ATG17072 [Phytophthora infestans]